MQKGTNLTNHFLIAMPGLRDPNFARSLTYICEHGEHGAMGIVVNRPTELRLGDILEQMDIQITDPTAELEPVYSGGPVQPDRGFVLHTGGNRWASTLRITPQIYLTTSRDILEAIAAGEGPERMLIALGYAGWGGGQLESEMLANAWLSGPADLDIVFQRPVDQRWYAAAQRLGVDMHLMTASAGHA